MENTKRNFQSTKEYLVGVSYFAGWWEGKASKWIVNGEDWRDAYPNRVPLLGQSNSQDTMDKEIIAASDHGVDFFQILWYPCHNPGIDAPHAEHLNEGVKFFMASPESSRMRFCMEYCNHPPFAVSDEAIWKQTCAELISYMKHPSYLRVGGKAMFKIHSVRHFLADCGENIEKAAAWIAYLRKLAINDGVGEIMIGAGSWTEDDFSGMPELMAQCDYTQFYMGMPNLPQKDEDYGYDQLIGYALDEAKRCEKVSPLPFLPFVPSGWNPKPWGDDRANFALPKRDEWTSALAKMKILLDETPRLRIPDATPEGQKMLCIYCWNEYGEGGIVAPNAGDGLTKLEAISSLFGRI